MSESDDASPKADFYYPLGIPKSADEMPEKCVYIVQGKLLDDAQESIEYLDELIDFGTSLAPEDRTVSYAVTISTLEITKVIQGNLQVGDQIKLAESYYTREQDGIKTIQMAPGYTKLYAPSEVDKEYLFFFDNPPESGKFAGLYFPLWRELGRYPVISPYSRSAFSIDTMSNEELNLGEGDATEYKEFYQQVVNQFMR